MATQLVSQEARASRSRCWGPRLERTKARTEATVSSLCAGNTRLCSARPRGRKMREGWASAVNCSGGSLRVLSSILGRSG